jgi:hypothetical protein
MFESIIAVAVIVIAYRAHERCRTFWQRENEAEREKREDNTCGSD